MVKDQLNAALWPSTACSFAPELSTSNRATIGGMISTDASGQGSCLYGKTRDHVLRAHDRAARRHRLALGPARRRRAARLTRRGRPRRRHPPRGRQASSASNATLIAARFPKLNRCLTGYDLAHIRDGDGPLRPQRDPLRLGGHARLHRRGEAERAADPRVTSRSSTCATTASTRRCVTPRRSLRFGAASIETVDSKVLALAQEDIVWEDVRGFLPRRRRRAGARRQPGRVRRRQRRGRGRGAAAARLTAALDAEGPSRGRRGYTRRPRRGRRRSASGRCARRPSGCSAT